MTRPILKLGVPMLLALASAPVFAQQLQQPNPPARPSTQPAAMPAPPAVPATPSQRGMPPGTIPSTGPAPQVRPQPTMRANPPVTPRVMPTQVRDAQGRIVPGAQEVVPGRARDPVTGQEFQTAPVPRPF
ncbi:hypothetical protein [Luteimonas sp. 9C]|uniref:hypothetical protein n=1 Tax=Luteimonas sp. 9C TaxID=2653148 RepID=UPI0013571F98|nr:hypothetical protein [Luteimonas sp. 9C]